MPARRNASREPSAPPVPSVLKLPQPQAEAKLQKRIQAGRDLAGRQIPGLDPDPTRPSEFIIFASGRGQGGLARPHLPELETLKSDVHQWRDYNRTLLSKILGGEAAEEYERSSTHWGAGGSDDPYVELRFLREDIESEISKLQSIHDRLEFWVPDDTPSVSNVMQASADAPIFIVHGSDTLRAESVARTVEQATGRRTIILREQASLGRTLIEKFEHNAARASYAVIVLTSDDEGSRKGEGNHRPRGRQNVIFEMGYFYGTLGRSRVSVLLAPGVEKPSDMDGIAYISLDNNGAWETQLFRELEHAHIRTDMSSAF
jgi:predicted nucleotide-binding protein